MFREQFVAAIGQFCFRQLLFQDIPQFGFYADILASQLQFFRIYPSVSQIRRIIYISSGKEDVKIVKLS